MKIIGILIAIVVLAGGVSFFAGWWGNTPEREVENKNVNGQQVDERVVRGTVLSINSEGIVVDKPHAITITETDGSTEIIYIPSMGLLVCAARGEIASTDTLEVGNVVEARGEVGVEGAITPCMSADHYFRILSE